MPFMIHLPDGHMYGADGLSCGIPSVYPKAQFYFHVLPVRQSFLLQDYTLKDFTFG